MILNNSLTKKSNPTFSWSTKLQSDNQTTMCVVCTINQSISKWGSPTTSLPQSLQANLTHVLKILFEFNITAACGTGKHNGHNYTPQYLNVILRKEGKFTAFLFRKDSKFIASQFRGQETVFLSAKQIVLDCLIPHEKLFLLMGFCWRLSGLVLRVMQTKANLPSIHSTINHYSVDLQAGGWFAVVGFLIRRISDTSMTHLTCMADLIPDPMFLHH